MLGAGRVMHCRVMHWRSVRTTAWWPAPAHIVDSSCSSRSKFCRAMTAMDGPAPDRNAPSTSGSSSASTSAQQRHHRRARRLVPAIAHALAEPLVVLRLQGVDERQHALHVEDRVAAVQVIRQRRAGLRRGEAHRRRHHDQPQLIGPCPVERSGACAFVGNHRREAAKERRRRVVGVPFEARWPPPAARDPTAGAPPFRTGAARPPWPRRCCPGRPPSGWPLSTSTCTVGVLIAGPLGDQVEGALERVMPLTEGELCVTTSRVPAVVAHVHDARAECTAARLRPRCRSRRPRLATEPGTVTSPGEHGAVRSPLVVLSDTK